jgi:hypothetical protein
MYGQADRGIVQRGAERVQLHCEAVLTLGDGRRVEALVRNISTSGMRLFCRDLLPIGELARVTIAGGGEHPIQIVWQLGVSAGIEFKPHLTWRSVVAPLLAESEEQEGLHPGVA